MGKFGYKMTPESRRVEDMLTAMANKDTEALERIRRGHKRGDIYYISKENTDDAIGGEISGTGRPCVIISNDDINYSSRTVLVAFLTSKENEATSSHVKLYFNGRHATVLCDHIKSVDKSRFENFARSCTEEEMKAIDKALIIAMGLQDSCHHNAEIKDVLLSEQSQAPETTEPAAPAVKISEEELKEVTAQANDASARVKELEEELLRTSVERDLLRKLYNDLTTSLIASK